MGDFQSGGRMKGAEENTQRDKSESKMHGGTLG